MLKCIFSLVLGPFPGILDLAQVVLSPDQSQEVLAIVAVFLQLLLLSVRPVGRVGRVVVAADLVVHQHFKPGPDLQEHQTVRTHNF